jgi:hypothetical protein
MHTRKAFNEKERKKACFVCADTKRC